MNSVLRDDVINSMVMDNLSKDDFVTSISRVDIKSSTLKRLSCNTRTMGVLFCDFNKFSCLCFVIGNIVHFDFF